MHHRPVGCAVGWTLEAPLPLTGSPPPSLSDEEELVVVLREVRRLFSSVPARRGGGGDDGAGSTPADAVDTAAAVGHPAGTPACLRRTPSPAGHAAVD